MKRIVAILFCMSVLCFLGCRSGNSSNTNDVDSLDLHPDTFNRDNVTFTFISANTAEIEYDPRVAPKVKKYFACTASKLACEQSAKRDSVTDTIQVLKTQKDRPGFLKARVFVASGARCYYVIALKNDGTIETLSKDINQGQTCTDK